MSAPPTSHLWFKQVRVLSATSQISVKSGKPIIQLTCEGIDWIVQVPLPTADLWTMQHYGERYSGMVDLDRITPEKVDVIAYPHEHDGVIYTRCEVRTKPPARQVWYRGWECGQCEERTRYGIEPWVGYQGGADLDCPTITAKTWDALLEEIDATF